MKLTTETVSRTIKGWSMLYPSANRTPAQSAFIASEFFNELKNVFSDEAFLMAASKVKRHCKFFPTIADMYSVKEEVDREIVRKKQLESSKTALPETTDPNTPEERELAKKRLAVIHSAISGKITYKEAEERLESMVGYAQR